MTQITRQQFTRDFRPVEVTEIQRRTRAEGANLTPAQQQALSAADLDHDGRVGNSRAEVDAAWSAVRGMDTGTNGSRVTSGQGEGFEAARALTSGHSGVADDRRLAGLPAATRDRVRQLEVDGNRDADGNLSRIATSPGFAQLPEAQQRQMLDAHARHPGSAQVSTELTGLAQSGNFRGLDPATQTQALEQIGRHGGGTQTAAVAGARGFGDLPRASQDRALRAVDAHPRDAAVGRQITQLAGDGNFRALPQDTQTQALDQVARHGANNQVSTVATAAGFGQLSRARQQQMLDTVDAHPADRRLGNELRTMANSGHFRGLPDATQRRATELVGTHGAGSTVPGLATSRGFSQVGEAQQARMLEGVHGRPTDRGLAQEYSQLGNSARFRGLNPDTQTQAIDTMARHGHGTTVPTLVNAPGFGDVSRARQQQMLDTVNAHPRDTRVAHDLGELSGNTRFRALPDATQQQLITMTGAGHAPANVRALATSADFARLDPARQTEMLTQIDRHPGDARVVRDYGALAGSATFRGLPAASQTRVIDQLSTQSASAHVGGLNEAAILARGGTADGAGELRAMGDVMRAGGLDAAERREARRIDAATFRPGVGFHVAGGTAADQATFNDMTRREMLRSPSFHRMMMDQNADAAHPLNITVGRNQPGHYVDAFNGGGNHTFDMADMLQWPDRPPVGRPDAMTQGENLVHGIAEARHGARGHGYDPSHREGIRAENEYRRDIGQASRLRMPPNDTTRNAAGNTEFQFNNGYREETLGGTNVTGIVGHGP